MLLLCTAIDFVAKSSRSTSGRSRKASERLSTHIVPIERATGSVPGAFDINVASAENRATTRDAREQQQDQGYGITKITKRSRHSWIRPLSKLARHVTSRVFLQRVPTRLNESGRMHCFSNASEQAVFLPLFSWTTRRPKCFPLVHSLVMLRVAIMYARSWLNAGGKLRPRGRDLRRYRYRNNMILLSLAARSTCVSSLPHRVS